MCFRLSLVISSIINNYDKKIFKSIYFSKVMNIIYKKQIVIN